MPEVGVLQKVFKTNFIMESVSSDWIFMISSRKSSKTFDVVAFGYKMSF